MPRSKRRSKLNTKFLLGFVVFAMALSIAVCVVGYTEITDLYTEAFTQDALTAAHMAARLVDGDAAQRYLETKTKDAAYEETMERISLVKEALNLKYVYVFYPGEDGYHYVFDAPADYDTVPVYELGDVQPYELTTNHIRRLISEGGETPELLVTRSSEGYVGTVFVAINDSTGKPAALVGVDVSMDRLEQKRWQYVRSSILWSVLVVVVMVAIYLSYLQRRLVQPIRKLTVGVDGYLQAEQRPDSIAVDIRTNDEVQTLSEAFTHMTHDLNHYIDNLQNVTAEKERIQTELDVATEIQMSILPRIFPPFPECKDFQIYATIDPAKEVGGDFYDFFRLDDHRLCVVVGDVSGKGVPAALFMMIAKTLIKTEAQQCSSLAEVFAAVNRQMAENNERSMFVTALLAVLDTDAHTLTYVNAGHNPPLVCRADGSYEWLQMRRSLPLAAMPNMHCREESIPFDNGDVIFLYTDGVTEALNPSQELYGELRLQEALNQAPRLPEAMIAHVTASLSAYVSGAAQADDITMVSLLFTPTERG